MWQKAIFKCELSTLPKDCQILLLLFFYNYGKSGKIGKSNFLIPKNNGTQLLPHNFREAPYWVVRSTNQPGTGSKRIDRGEGPMASNPILETVHGTADGLHKADAMGATTMLCACRC